MDIATIIDQIPKQIEAMQAMRETILANAIMVGEIPAPTYLEDSRTQFICNRFIECGLQNISHDEKGNAMGLLNGRIGKKTILLLAHLDTPYNDSVDHTVSVDQDTLSGPAIGNNALGVAALPTLPNILEKLGTTFDDNILFLAHTRCLGFGDLEGFKFFIENNKLPLHAAIGISGAPLGRLSYTSVGMMRGNIVCTAQRPDLTQLGGPNAIASLNGIISSILNIPFPQEPKTNIILGKIQGGSSFSSVATRSQLGFEVRSDQAGMVDEIEQQIQSIVDHVQNDEGENAELQVIARRNTGGLSPQHPLVNITQNILQKLDIPPVIRPSAGALASLIEHKVPAVAIGLTRGHRSTERSETIEIEPIYVGLAQLIAMMQAIDGGLCDVDEN